MRLNVVDPGALLLAFVQLKIINYKKTAQSHDSLPELFLGTRCLHCTEINISLNNNSFIKKNRDKFVLFMSVSLV